MNLYITYINALDPQTGEMKKWCGPEVPGLTFQMAREYCQLNGLGYCKVAGLLVAEIPCKPGTHEPDFDGMIDYEAPGLN